jgi:hypothetical protein
MNSSGAFDYFVEFKNVGREAIQAEKTHFLKRVLKKGFYSFCKVLH